MEVTLYAKWDLGNSVATLPSDSFMLYPNPANNMVKLEGKNMQ